MAYVFIRKRVFIVDCKNYEMVNESFGEMKVIVIYIYLLIDKSYKKYQKWLIKF